MKYETSFRVPMEAPASRNEMLALRAYLVSLADSIGVMGRNGDQVGIGYEWWTTKGLESMELRTLARLSKRLWRALTSVGIVSPHARPYFLTSRFRYIRNADPYGTITLKEGD